MRFDFNEANILNQNLFSSTDNKEVLIDRLQILQKNTEDLILKKSVESLIRKIEGLSNEDVRRILYDVLKKRFIVTANSKVGQRN